MFDKIKTVWGKFEGWVHSWMPGFKTYITLGLGVVGDSAYAAKDYMTQLPLDKFVTESQIAIFSLVVTLLALWFHNMGERVEARAD